MADHEIGLFLKSYNQMGPGLGAAGNAIHMFTTNGKKEMSGLKASMLGLGIAAGAVAGALFAMAKRAADFDEKMLDIKASGELTTAQMLGMKDSILKSSMAWGYSADKVADMSKGFAETSNDAAFLTKNMDFLTMGLAASRMNAEEYGTSLGKLKKDFKGTDDEFKHWINSIYSATQQPGREQTFAKLIPNLAPIMKAYQATHPGDIRGLEKLGLLAAFSPDPATLTQMISKLMKAGIKGIEKFSPRATKGPLWALQQLGFGSTDMRGLGPSQILERMANMKDPNERLKVFAALTGKSGLAMAELRDQYEKFAEASKHLDIEALKKEAIENSKALSSSFTKIGDAFTIISTKTMAKPLQDFADFLNKLKPEDINALADAMKGLGTSLTWFIKLAELPIKGVEGLMYGLFQLLHPDLAKAYNQNFPGEQSAAQKEQSNKIDYLHKHPWMVGPFTPKSVPSSPQNPTTSPWQMPGTGGAVHINLNIDGQTVATAINKGQKTLLQHKK
ncbi:MAG: hypothetical protein ABSA76_14325 [Bacteroidales bacterium]